MEKQAEVFADCEVLGSNDDKSTNNKQDSTKKSILTAADNKIPVCAHGRPYNQCAGQTAASTV
jgi:hypothetical protein